MESNNALEFLEAKKQNARARHSFGFSVTGKRIERYLSVAGFEQRKRAPRITAADREPGSVADAERE